MTDPTPWIEAVRASHDRFAALVRPLSADEVTGPSYDSEWSIADVASHLGSQAEIFKLFLDAGLNGTPAPGQEVFPAIWDRWNETPPPEQVAGSVTANDALVSRIEDMTEGERSAFALTLFGMDLDLTGFTAMRLSEHAVHTWDIEVALDPAATIAPSAVALLVDRVDQAAARSGRAIDDAAPVAITTTDPARSFRLTLSPAVSLVPAVPAMAGADQLGLPAEALLRLVFGRLDVDHTPAGITGDRLDQLRGVFPGF